MYSLCNYQGAWCKIYRDWDFSGFLELFFYWKRCGSGSRLDGLGLWGWSMHCTVHRLHTPDPWFPDGRLWCVGEVRWLEGGRVMVAWRRGRRIRAPVAPGVHGLAREGEGSRPGRGRRLEGTWPSSRFWLFLFLMISILGISNKLKPNSKIPKQIWSIKTQEFREHIFKQFSHFI